MLTKYGYYSKRSNDTSLSKRQRNYASSFLIGANNPNVNHSSERWQPYYDIPKNHPNYGKKILPPAKNEIGFKAGQRYIKKNK